jgi:hypothetical protein
MGRSSLDAAVRAAAPDRMGLVEATHVAFDALLARTPWPQHRADRGYLVIVVLPIAALYTALRERGITQHDAVETVRDVFLTTGARERALFSMVFRTGLGRRLFLRSLRPNWLWLTPLPANVWTVTERTRDAVTIEVSHCYRWETFRVLGVPEVAQIACDYEEYMFNGSPHLRVTWTAMPAGAEQCRMCLRASQAPAVR